MKILFISSRDVNWKSNGGELCTNRNYISFIKLVGKKNVTVINLLSESENSKFHPIRKRYFYLFGFNEGLTKDKLKEIISISYKYDIIFIDTSLYGIIAKYLKKAGYEGKIVCFFHNVELKVRYQRFKVNPFKLIEFILAYINEKQALKHADEVIVLNQRDYNKLKSYYKLLFNYRIIPISLVDKYKQKNDQSVTARPPVFLFTGNNWYANIMGIRWFISNVLDEVNIILQITGKDMEKYISLFSHPKIQFLGFVESLDEIMINADYIISPIFVGGGMKVKICEALMYGKNIIGTAEAFEGYEIDTKKIGAMCHTKEEFISEIKKLSQKKIKKFNQYSRELFLNKYSFDTTLKYFSQIING